MHTEKIQDIILGAVLGLIGLITIAGIVALGNAAHQLPTGSYITCVQH